MCSQLLSGLILQMTLIQMKPSILSRKFPLMTFSAAFPKSNPRNNAWENAWISHELNSWSVWRTSFIISTNRNLQCMLQRHFVWPLVSSINHWGRLCHYFTALLAHQLNPWEQWHNVNQMLQPGSNAREFYRVRTHSQTRPKLPMPFMNSWFP